MAPRLLAVLLAALLTPPAAALAHEAASADLELHRLEGSVPSPIRAAMDARSGSSRALAERDLPGDFQLVGHEPLLNRGMNSALAVHTTAEGRFAYVGSRTDGSHANAGVMVVDVTKPEQPSLVHEIGPPHAGNLGESSRELRVLPDKGLLLVLNHACSELIHRCANPSLTGRSVLTRSNVRVFDVSGENAAEPRLLATYEPSRNAPQQPHEFFVWTDPGDRDRVLLFSSTPSSERSGQPQLVVTDFSDARKGDFAEIATWRPEGGLGGEPDVDKRLHSLTVSHDGTRAYLAYLGGGFLVLDTSQVAAGAPEPSMRLVTPPGERVSWGDPGAHSAARLPGRNFALTTDEVYGKLGGVLREHGCPWGWVRTIDIADPARPRVAADFKLPVNETSSCASVDPDRDNLASFSAHNPTLTEDLALVTWHSAGLQAIDLSNPRSPRAAAQFLPKPLPVVQTEDPALSSGPDKVVMWSFPVIVDGLVYVVDLRNGLYVLRYDGPHADQVRQTAFLDGNSNSGDVARMETAAVGPASPGGDGGPRASGARPRPR